MLMHEHEKRWRQIVAGVLAAVALTWGALAAYAVKTTKTCVATAAASTLTSAVSSSLTPRRAWEVQNNGPNAIWCKGFNNTPAVGDGHKITSGASTWSMDQTTSNGDSSGVIKCIAETADQVGNACTDLSEAF